MTRARNQSRSHSTQDAGPGVSRHQLWLALISASDDLAEMARRYATLDEEGRLPVAETPARTSAPRRETQWRKLDEAELRALDKPGTSAEKDRAELETLRRGAHARVERMTTELRQLDGAAALDEKIWMRIEQTLRIHFDERILERLPNYLRPSWSRLHTASNNGGRDFYRFIDEDLVTRSRPSLLFEVYYFCLEHDFVGLHVSNPQAITTYLDNLEARIDLAPPEHHDPQQLETTQLREPWPTQRYYIVAALASVLFIVLLTLATNYPLSSDDAEPSDSSEPAASTGTDTDEKQEDATPSASPSGAIGMIHGGTK